MFPTSLAQLDRNVGAAKSLPPRPSSGWIAAVAQTVPFHITLAAMLIVRSRDSDSLPFCDGGIPRWSSINLQVDNHLLEFRAIGLTHLVLHE